MTTITGTLYDPSGEPVGGVPVRASLVAASTVLAAGGQLIREVTTYTAADGTWSLTLTPLDNLAVSEGAYYIIAADGYRWTVDVPASGSHELHTVLVEPAPLGATGATTAALGLRWRVAVWSGSQYVDPGTATAFVRQGSEIVAFLGGPTDPTTVDGDLWIDLGD